MEFPAGLFTDVRYESVYSTTISFENGVLKQNKTTLEQGAFIRVFDGRRWYYSATTDLNSVQEEIDRVVPVIEMIKKEFDVPVSIDSYKNPVVAEALKAGAGLVNDVWGLKYDRKVADLIAQYKVPCCLMHNREKAEYNNFLDEFCEDMRGCLSIAKEAGIADDQIILDPGVGFGKNYEHNLTIIHHLERLCDMGYPVLLATSRKSCIGQALDLPTDQRVEGTMVTTVMGVLKGAAFVRVHDVKENLRAIRMTQAILRDGRNG